MRFIVVQIQSQEGPVHVQIEHDGFPSTGKPITLGSRQLAIKNARGQKIGELILPAGFTVGRE